MTTDGDRTFPAESRRARVALLAVGAVVLLAIAVGSARRWALPAGTIASLADRRGRSGLARPSAARTPAKPGAWTPA